ncbi:hypothetical protein NADFUDRAFT_46317 [Nadsonia fulvescens var. elongata DSM 6958]|uniref:Golgi to ER traffic protein 1 n=1 Tax=Nadsonia fulvescens var. elongata DSM 6958 TaxID=857566 RepID=A0A1E3PJR1_9ASCO|nr:hypothetical protein NADFUDRAFT_46317 [Nadsonia fulvescens var. elongata DSM 6958]
MVNLFILVIVLSIAQKLISLIGKDVICDFLWDIYIQVAPLAQLTKLRAVQKKAIQTHAAMQNTSTKDEFAKWAKLDREYSKLKKSIEEINDSLGSSKTSFKRFIKSLIFISTTGVKVFLRIWYRKQPVFWLPQGAFPYYIEWVLAFPSAPTGSVAVGSWIFIVDRALDALFS